MVAEKQYDLCNADYSQYIRTYGNSADSGTNTTWAVATGNKLNQQGFIGQLGIAFANKIFKEQKIPVCILNGGVGGQRIQYFLRQNNNIFTLQNAYGRLMTRVKNSGALNHVRAIIWYQGENDAYSGTSYVDYFNSNYLLFNNLLEDNIGIENIYMYQIKNGCSSSARNIEIIQQAQSDVAKTYPKTIFISTADVPHADDNCHLKYFNGYKVLAAKLFRYINHFQYGAGISDQDFCPTITSAYCQNSEIVLLNSLRQNITTDSCAALDFYVNSSSQYPSFIYTHQDTIFLHFKQVVKTGDSISYCGHPGNYSCNVLNGYGNSIFCFGKLVVSDINTPIDSISIGELPSEVNNDYAESISIDPPVIPTNNSETISWYIPYPKNEIIILNQSGEKISANLWISTSEGRIVKRQSFDLQIGKNLVEINQFPTDIYYIKLSIEYNGTTFSYFKKFIRTP